LHRFASASLAALSRCLPTIGTAGFSGPPDTPGEVTSGYGMVEPEWRTSYGTEAWPDWSRTAAHGGVRAVNAGTDLDNIDSQRVLEKNGLQ